ncbi:NAD(P)-dependent oxidoreductase [Deinococcus oregonensis]|uniref:NAD(P)-dependent oxidoreductase n=1 Tax=Deinococcus oregonensis TaxID=1805970 RepID=A0ABV6B017_9DEIO
MTLTTAFLGLGAMGTPMAAHLTRHAQANGGRSLVWNRTAARAEAHAQAYGSEQATPELLAEADVLFSCLPTSADLDEVLAALPALKRGAVWVDCTSGHPDAAPRQAAALAERGVAFLDAPVSGGTGGAESGQLTVMVGGPEADLERVRPLLDTFAGRVIRVGDTGAGFAVKAINNALLAVTLWATGEGLAVLGRSGVNLGAALDVINASSGRSNSSQNLIPARVLTREFPATFGLGLLAKDAGIALDMVNSTKSSAPMLAQTAGLMRAAANIIGSDVDHTAALQLIEQMNKVVIQ